jgi:alpha-beta hydrolase superfamily lysophospholipase
MVLPFSLTVVRISVDVRSLPVKSGQGFEITVIYSQTGLLIVVLHGDSPDRPPTYQYRFAEIAATAISELKARYHPRRVVLVGHSGGSAIMANLLGQQGNIADAALLVSCPCDLAEWRRHMQSMKRGAMWQRPVHSLSPLSVIDAVPVSVRIWMLVGGDDQVTLRHWTLAYAEALRNRGVAVGVTVPPGLGHHMLLEPIAIERLKEAVGTIGSGR